MSVRRAPTYNIHYYTGHYPGMGRPCYASYRTSSPGGAITDQGTLLEPGRHYAPPPHPIPRVRSSVPRYTPAVARLARQRPPAGDVVPQGPSTAPRPRAARARIALHNEPHNSHTIMAAASDPVSSFAGPRGMVGAARLKRRVAAGEVTTGIGCTDPVPTAIVELAIRAGIDFMYVTMEHGHHSDQQVAEMAAIARRLDWVLMIRPIDSTPATLRKCMDLGCSGLVLPAIESAAELDRVRDAIWLPPRGTRRPGGFGNHWVSGETLPLPCVSTVFVAMTDLQPFRADFQYSTWKAQVEDHFIVLPMIESKAGLENVAEIAAHELTTHVDIGPYDLALSLGIDYYARPPPGEHDPLVAAIVTCREAAAAHGKQLLGAWGEPEEMLAAGDHFMMVGEPTSLLLAALTTQNQKVKGAQQVAAKL